ncbi:MAG: recombinase family protein [Parcubacteria group bacterium]
MDGRFVAYYRVSTRKQGDSGLGLEAQKKAVTDYLNGGAWELVGEFEEVESGSRADRPALDAAIQQCRLTGARLLIAKLDRLSRDVHFLTGLEKQGIDFVAADMPMATRLTVHIMAAVAQQEREAISVRTKAALGSIKARLARGEPYISKRSGRLVDRLGGPTAPKNRDPRRATDAAMAKADLFAKRVTPTVTSIHQAGLSLRQIADRLNTLRVQTPRARNWTATSVKRILDRDGRVTTSN